MVASSRVLNMEMASSMELDSSCHGSWTLHFTLVYQWKKCKIHYVNTK